MKTKNKIYILAILGILVGIYLTFLHFSDISSVCEFSESFSCDVVNKSIYSIFPPVYGLGIPVAILGIITMIIVIILTKLANRKNNYAKYLFYLMIGSFLFSLYLLAIEIFYLHRYCVFCLVLDLIIICLLILSFKLKSIHISKHQQGSID